MLRLFQSTGPLTLFFYFIFTVALQLHLFIYPVPFTTQYETLPANQLFIKWLHVHELPLVVITSIHILLVALTGLFISLLLRTNKIIQKGGLMPGAVFVVIVSWFPEVPLLSPELFAALILTLLLFRIFRTYNQAKVDSLLFDTGLFTAFISLIFYPAIILIAFGIFAIYRLRSTSLREFLVIVSGFIVVYFLVFTAVYWFDLLPVFTGQFYFPLSLPDMTEFMQTLNIVKFILLGSALLVSLWVLLEKYSANLVQVRKYILVFINLFFFSIFLLFFSPVSHTSQLQFLLIPISVFYSNFFMHSRSNLTAEIVFLSMTVAAVIFQYINFA